MAFYRHVSSHFDHSRMFPTTMDMVISFIVSQVNSGLSGKTIISQLSAVAFIHKLSGFPDPTTHFLIKKLLVGATRLNSSSDTRLPILKPILHKLIQSIPCVMETHYIASMLKAMYLLAFHAFLRPSEFTTNYPPTTHVLKIDNLKLIYSSSKQPKTLSITFHSYKHSPQSSPFTICLKRSLNTDYCPVSAMASYLSIRPNLPGPVFIFPDSQPVTRSYFKSCLDKSLAWSSLSTAHYKPHSFRIGAATQAALSYIPDQRIKLLGRWHSDAYKKYIRVPML